MAEKPGMSGAKVEHSGMRPLEVKNVVVKKGNKTAEKTEGKVDKGPEKKDNKEEKAGEKKNTGGEASKGGNREQLKHGAKPPAAGAAAAENLGMGNGGETAEEETAGNTGKNEDKRKERGQSEKENGGNSSGPSKENNQEKKSGEKEKMGEQKGEDEAGERVKYDVELTVIVSVEGKLSMMDLLLGIQKQCGVIVGCRTKVDGSYEITMKTLGGKRALLDGIREKGIVVNASDGKMKL
ncbi:hypothetical protein NQZ68_034525 [Dissostichus eleginoides]|nr:hypothetical protein NQZ68_034525 [Dissostichus eleginoides]